MAHYRTDDVRIEQGDELLAPMQVMRELAATERSEQATFEGRKAVHDILRGADDRLLVVVGPCSIHDSKAALDYAARLAAERERLKLDLAIVMRVYFEKPRTTVGWKGFINDPHLDGSYDIETGLKTARRLLVEIAGLGLPSATEFLDPITPQYLADLVSWAAIGARTTESQTHRQMASGLSMPVGFKNGTDGGLQIALDAMGAAMHPHSFLGIDQDGITSIVRTTGNPDGHIVLRGGRQHTNYDSASIAAAADQLSKAGLPRVLMVDCSHANSGKQHARQEDVWQSVVAQRVAGNAALIGLMVESYLQPGSQPIPTDLTSVRYDVSVTDPCIGWDTTERMLRYAHKLMGGTERIPALAPTTA